jgi:transposase
MKTNEPSGENEITQFISPKEAARRLQSSLGFVHRALQEGRLQGVKFSGIWLIDPNDLDGDIKRRKGNYKLSEEEIRSIPLLYYDDELEVDEIAERLGVSGRTIYRYLARYDAEHAARREGDDVE